MSEELAIGLRETRNDIKQLLAGQATLAAQVNQMMQNQSTSIDVRTRQGEDLAVVKNVMIAFSKYQDKCELDREEIHKKMVKVENFQNNQKQAFIGMASLITFGGLGLSKVLEKWDKIIGMFS
jgi:hypothetical protein